MPAPIPTLDLNSALSLRAQGLSFVDIAKEFGCKVDTLRQSFYRKGMHKLLSQTRGTVTAKVLAERSTQFRDRLATQVETTLEKLETAPVKSAKELGNTPDGEGRASVLNKLADVAAKVYGDWDTADKVQRISLTRLTVNNTVQAQPGQAQAGPVIDVRDED